MVVGPGLSKADAAVAAARALVARAQVPVVLDADGLNAHAGRLVTLAARKAPTVLTPHAGELGRLLGVESREVGARRLHHARAAAEQAQAIVVLKGDDTLVPRAGSASARAARPRWRRPGPATCSPASSPRCSPTGSTRSRPPAPPCGSISTPAGPPRASAAPRASSRRT
jgi:NAD(P)H-hydrate epimerase